MWGSEGREAPMSLASREAHRLLWSESEPPPLPKPPPQTPAAARDRPAAAQRMRSVRSTATRRHGDTLSRRHSVTATLCHGDTRSRRHSVTATLCHGDTLSRRHSVTLSRRHRRYRDRCHGVTVIPWCHGGVTVVSRRHSASSRARARVSRGSSVAPGPCPGSRQSVSSTLPSLSCPHPSQAGPRPSWPSRAAP